jgi:hypothetical protein
MKYVKNTVLTASIIVFLQVLGTHIKYIPNKRQNARVNATAEIKTIWQMDVTFVLMNHMDLVFLQIHLDSVCFPDAQNNNVPKAQMINKWWKLWWQWH